MTHFDGNQHLQHLQDETKLTVSIKKCTIALITTTVDTSNSTTLPDLDRFISLAIISTHFGGCCTTEL